MRSINIRGALGTQLISYAASLEGDDIEFVFFNTGGDIADNIKRNYLTDIVADAPPVIPTNGKHKVRFDVPGVLARAADWAMVMPLTRKVAPTNETILHIRRGDRHATSDATYLKMAVTLGSVVCMGSESTNDPVDEWFRILNAKIVYSSVSMFTLSAAMCRPQLQLRILEPDGPVPLLPGTMAELRKLNMPNVKWITP